MLLHFRSFPIFTVSTEKTAFRCEWPAADACIQLFVIYLQGPKLHLNNNKYSDLAMKTESNEKWVVCRVCLNNPGEGEDPLHEIFSQTASTRLDQMLHICAGIPVSRNPRLKWRF